MSRRLAASLLLCIMVATLSACDDDDPTAVVSYDITIVNNDAVTYEVWIDADVDVEEYEQDGVVEANTSRVLADRTISVAYFIRLVTPGQNPNLPDEDFVHEAVITSNGPSLTWTVPPVP